MGRVHELMADAPLQGGRVKGDSESAATGGLTARAIARRAKLAAGPEFRRLYQIVVGIAKRTAGVVLDPDRAGDVALEVGVEFWQGWLKTPERFADETQLGGWATTAARMTMRDQFTSAQRRAARDEAFVELTESFRATTVDPIDLLESLRLQAAIQGAVQRMPVLRREVFIRVKEDGLSHDDVAQERGVSISTVRAHMTRALDDLREALSAIGVTPPGRRSDGGASKRNTNSMGNMGNMGNMSGGDV